MPHPKGRRVFAWCVIVVAGSSIACLACWILQLNLPRTGVLVEYHDEQRILGVRVWHGGVSGRSECLTANGEPVVDSRGRVIQHGKSETWDRIGRRRLLTYARYGVRYGEATSWHENGAVMSIEEYDPDGKAIRLRTWDASGVLRLEVVGGGSLLAGGTCYRYDETGVLESVATWLNHELHGPYERFHPSGTTAEQGEYFMGKKAGVWTYWAESGQSHTEEYTEPNGRGE